MPSTLHRELDLTGFRLHEIVNHVEVGGLELPSIRGTFYLRDADDDGGPVVIGVYTTLGGEEILAVWGHPGVHEHRFHAVRSADGGWHVPQEGRPVVRPVRAAGRMVGFAVAAPSPAGVEVFPVQEFLTLPVMAERNVS